MSDNSYQVYLNNTFKLAFTMIVKSEYIAKKINDRLLEFKAFETDIERPESWKYYMNLAGEYHSTDTVMKVISSDNLDEIIFNPANLIRHPNTRRDYQFGTRQYGELLEKYPDQEEVILGILYPVNKEIAISSPDHKILGYPSNMIEVNEYTLIEQLQEWTNIYFKRYYNWQYTISDAFYYPVMHSMYGMNLYQAILTYRHQKHKSIEAHSYYVSEYLASNSDLGKYHKFMSLPQAMYFYRNIRYHQRHPGTNDSLEKLIDALLTKRSIPIAGYEMLHDTTPMTTDSLRVMSRSLISDESSVPASLYPELTFKRTDLTVIPSAGTPEFSNLNTFLTKEIPEALGNEEEVLESEVRVNRFMQNSPSNVVETKLLESSMIDYTGAQTYKLEDVQISHWLYYASLGFYTAIVNVPNPRTSARIVLNVKDAYVLALYCMYKSYDITPEVVPLLGAQRVLRFPLITEEEATSIVDMRYISDFTKTASRNMLAEVESLISIDAFYEKTMQLHRIANYQRNLVAYQEGMHERGETFKLISRYWQDAYVRLEDKDLTYQDWLFSRNLNFDNLDRNDFSALYTSIVNNAIGKTLSTAPSVRNIQKAMANTLKDLSSYTIQVVTRISDEETIMTDLPSIRVGNQEIDAGSHQYLRVGNFDVIKQNVDAVNRVSMENNIFADVLRHDVSASTRHYLDISNGPHEPSRGTFRHTKVAMSRMEIGVRNKPDITGTNLQPLLGMGDYIGLTSEQKLSLFE